MCHGPYIKESGLPTDIYRLSRLLTLDDRINGGDIGAIFGEMCVLYIRFYICVYGIYL